mgnify:CR=1 FL=1
MKFGVEKNTFKIQNEELGIDTDICNSEIYKHGSYPLILADFMYYNGAQCIKNSIYNPTSKSAKKPNSKEMKWIRDPRGFWKQVPKYEFR